MPAIHRPLLAALEEGLTLKPFDPKCDGRTAMAIAVVQRLKCEFSQTDVRIRIAGPFSIAFNLRGITSLREDSAPRPEATTKLLMRLAENQAVLCRAIAAAGLDVAFFEAAAATPTPASFVWKCSMSGTQSIAASCSR